MLPRMEDGGMPTHDNRPHKTTRMLPLAHGGRLDSLLLGSVGSRGTDVSVPVTAKFREGVSRVIPFVT